MRISLKALEESNQRSIERAKKGKPLSVEETRKLDNATLQFAEQMRDAMEAALNEVSPEIN